MAKRLMKRTRHGTMPMTKRLLAMMMVLSLAMGLLPAAAFADGYSNQVADSYFAIDQNSTQEKPLEQGKIPDVTQDDYTVSKNINQTGENTFNIT